MLLPELGRRWWLHLLLLFLLSLIFCALARGEPSSAQLNDVGHLEPSEGRNRRRINYGCGGFSELPPLLLFFDRSRTTFCGLTRPTV